MPLILTLILFFMSLSYIRLKKSEDRRLRSGHPWIYSNEIDTTVTPLKSFSAGEEVIVEAHDKSPLAIAYINPHSLIAGRIISRHLSDRLSTEWFTIRMKRALQLREMLFSSPYYRLIFSEADEIPGLVIDRFANDFVVQINTAGMELKKEMIIDSLCTLFPSAQSILLRNDSSIREQEGLESYVRSAFGQSSEISSLEENETRFIFPLWKGQKTGWFYDHRLNRARLKQYVSNQNVLDVFSYLGAWGVQAAVYGATQVDCIEVSEFASHFIMKNAKLNHVDNKLNVICEDAFSAMKNLLRENKHYDVIILDPPAFVKKFKDRKEGLIAYQRLNEMALKLLNPQGILISCSCSMHVSMEDLIELLKRVAYRTQTLIQILERGHQAPDHPIHLLIPETDYLKVVIVRKIC